MNPAVVMKLMNELRRFQTDHPKVTAFVQKAFQDGLPEDTVIEMTVTKPGEEPITTNFRVLAADVQMMQTLKELRT